MDMKFLPSDSYIREQKSIIQQIRKLRTPPLLMGIEAVPIEGKLVAIGVTSRDMFGRK